MALYTKLLLHFPCNPFIAYTVFLALYLKEKEFIQSLGELSSVGVAGRNFAEVLFSLRVEQISLQRRKRRVSDHTIGNSRPLLV